MTSVESRIECDVKSAMKAGERVRVSTLRQLRSQLQYARLEERESWTEESAFAVLTKAAKMRQESILQYEKGNRADLVAREREELQIIEEYLPERLSEAEIDSIIDQCIAETGASSPRDMGKVMGVVMPKLKGRADGQLVNSRVRQKLSGE
jgi:uncharacterized protein